MGGIRLGILDQSPIISGYTPAQAVHETVRLAQAAEKLGFSRYWLAEHHAIAALADPCPEILAARVSAAGELVLLEHQDRRLWNRELIAAGSELVQRALRSRRFGPYTLQAAIAAVHAEAASAAGTDWAEIVGLYDVLRGIEPGPVVELNRAVAIAMRDGAAAGIALIDELLARGGLDDYHLAHSARADLCRRLGRREQAAAGYRRALELAKQEPERRFLERRLRELAV